MGMLKGTHSGTDVFTTYDNTRWLKLVRKGSSPSGFVIQEDSGGNPWWFWVDASNLRMLQSATAPTAPATDGTVVTGSGSGEANRTLSNLATVVCNTSIQSDTNLTDDSGDASYYWKSSYARDLYLNSTATIKGTTAGQIDVVGKLYVGTNAGNAAHDVIFYGYTAGQWMFWDENYNTNAGGLLLGDNVSLVVGAGGDLIIASDGTDVALDATTDDTVLNIGGTNDTDIKFHSHDNADKDCGWISDIYTWQFCDTTKVRFGGSAFDTVSDGVVFAFDGSDTLNIDANSANDLVRIGETTITNFYLDGATGYDVEWDGSDDEMLFNDNAKLVFGGTSDDAVIYSDGTLLQIELSGGGTTSGVVLNTYAAQTTAALHIDGATNDWDGADNVGMLHISNDAALIHAGAALLYVDNSAKPINSATGFVATFADTGTNVTTDPAYAVSIESTNNFGLNIVTAAAAAITNLTMSGAAGQTAAMLNMVGTTGAGWDGGAGVGMLNVAGDGAHADATAPLVNITDGTGASIASGRGTCLRIVDTTTVGADSWVAYIDTTANDGLLINTGHANGINLKLTGLQAQVAPMMLIDASTGTGWDGADDVGALEITSDSILVANGATLLRVESSAQQKSGSEGALARFENTGVAQADAVMVEIVAKDETEYAINVGAGISNFEANGICTAFGGGTNLTGTPTAAEFTTEFTATALTRPGFVGVAEDTGDGKNYIVVSDGTTWHYIALTAAS